MNKLILAFGFTLIAFSAFSQHVVTEANGRVTVRNNNDSIIAQIENVDSGAISAVFNDNKTEIGIVYVNGDVYIKKTDGSTIVQLAEENPDKATTVIWSGDSVIITTQSGQTFTKNALEWR